MRRIALSVAMAWTALLTGGAGLAGATTNVSGTVSGTWTPAGNPYVFTSTPAVVPVGQTLVIEPGVELVDTNLIVRGDLEANGTAADPIVVGPKTTSGAGLPLDIRAGANPVELSHLRFRGGSTIVRSVDRPLDVSHVKALGTGAINVTGGSIELTHSRFVRATGSAVLLNGVDGDVSDNEFLGIGGVTVWAASGSATHVHHNVLASLRGGVSLITGRLDPGATGTVLVEHNTIAAGAIQTRAGNDVLTIHDNNILPVPVEPYSVAHGAADDLDIPGNWWGTTDLGAIQARIMDGQSHPHLDYGAVDPAPVLTAPDPGAPVADLAPPDTVIDSVTRVPGERHTWDIAFHAVGGEDVFVECPTLTDSPDEACVSPQRVHLPDHAAGVVPAPFQAEIYAVSAAYVEDPTPAVAVLSDSQPSPPTLGGVTEGSTIADDSPDVTITGAPGEVFRCALDGATPAACTSPVALSDLSDGPHTFTALAVDPYLHTSANATLHFTVDTTPPPSGGGGGGGGGSAAPVTSDASTSPTPAPLTPPLVIPSLTPPMPTPTPPAGRVGVSIEDGARFTNARRVALRLVWPQGARTALIANDGGFADAREVALAPRVTWTLDESGRERLPKTVYVRFVGDGVDAQQTYSDDVILDRRAPEIRSARIVDGELRVSAADARSGVELLQHAARRQASGQTVAFARTTRLGADVRRRWVRVADRAGNWSDWTLAR